MRLHAGITLLLFASSASAAPPDAAALASRIDERLAKAWDGAKVKPAPLADDAAFARRVYLDLVGRIPTVAESRVFLADTDPKKREKLVDSLIQSGGHSRHAATFWRRVWLPQTDTPRFANLGDTFEDWLALRLANNAKYDELATALLTGRRPVTTGRANRGGQGGTPTQALFTASESKPENLAANAARAFLGVNLDCAQCHDHPFAKWTRNQFWETAAFFAPLIVAEGKPSKPEITIENTKKVVGPALLDGSSFEWPEDANDATGGELFTKWVTGKENAFFAKNAVNRLWAEYFGTGIVEPLDDLGGANDPSHPELLDELADAFIKSGYDLNYLTKAMMLSKAYQLSSSVQVAESADSLDSKLFARMPVRGLTGEQLYDSLRVASGLPVRRDDLDPYASRDRRRFANAFYTQRAATAQRSIVQSLALMNGSTTADVTDPNRAPTLVAISGAPFLDTSGKVEALFLAAVGRKPTTKEFSALAKHVDSGGTHKNSEKALADVFWALLNGTEFNTNH